MSERTWNLALERSAYQERTFPKVSGLGKANVSGEMSPGHHRLRAGESHHPFQATSCKRSGVKPSSGKVADTETGNSPIRLDDPYIADWVASGGAFGLPVPKTEAQSHLIRWCKEALSANMSGDDIDPLTADLIRAGISKIETDDPKQASAFRVAVIGCGIWS